VVGVLIANRSAPTVPVVEVRSTPFRARVTADGNLSAVRSTPLTSPMKPQMPFTLAWIVDDGAVVQADDVIARFDPSQLEKDREDGLSDHRISNHRITSAEVEREASVDKLDLDAEISDEELEIAREFQSNDSLIYSRIEIVESQIDTELAENRAAHARESQHIVDQLSEAEIELLEIERRKADLTIQRADEGLASLELRSPHGGIVILERDWRGNPVRVGDTVWPGRTLARIPDLSEMQAEVFILEADAGGLQIGQSASVWLEAEPEVMHPAKLTSIDPVAGRRNRRVPVQYFRAVLVLERTDRSTMKPGSRVHAEIVIADLASAITVPRQAVSVVDGFTVVYRWKRRTFERTEVELGSSAFGRVVVKGGLEDGDLVALRDPTTDEADDGGGPNPSGPLIPGAGS
jgi:RND family efflux transporter MFP subunit